MKSSSTDHRIRVTKMMVRKALLELMQQKQIEGITIKELCATAGINRGTFYAHYQDIYALLEQIESDMIADFGKALMPIHEHIADERFLLDICTGVFQCMKDNTDMCIVMLGKYGDQDFVDRLLLMGRNACLRAYARYFRNADQRKIQYFYAFVSQGCLGILREWIAEGATASAEELAYMAEEILLRGIGFFSGEENT